MLPLDTLNPTQRAISEDIEEQTKAFLAAGGKIDVIPTRIATVEDSKAKQTFVISVEGKPKTVRKGRWA